MIKVKFTLTLMFVATDEFDFGSCIGNLCHLCYLRTWYFLQQIAAMKISSTMASNITILSRGIRHSLSHHQMNECG